MLTVALVGYTNAGKSSILRALTGEHDIFVENRLFATLDTLTREVDLGEGVRVRVTDTVGFIRKLPHHLIASFRATLEEATTADVLLHVVDASHSDWEEHVTVVDGVLAELGLAERTRMLVFNKIDLLPEPLAFATRVRALYPDSVLTTVMRTDGLQSLKQALADRARSLRPTVRVEVPVTDGARLAALYRAGEVVAREDRDDKVILTIRTEQWRADQLAGEGTQRRKEAPRRREA
jgi:GTP-binding protein HflX